VTNPTPTSPSSTPFAQRFRAGVLASTATAAAFLLATTTLGVAQALAAAGLTSVTWRGVKDQGGSKKLPVEKGWNACTPLDALAIAEQHPARNIGVLLRRDLVVVDIDGPDGLRLFLTKMPLDSLPLGPRVKTGNGWHLYYRCTDLTGLKQESVALGAGKVEFFGPFSNRWIALPPSVHPDTQQPYYVEHADLPIPDLPREALAWLLHPRAESVASMASLDDTASRNNTLTSLGGLLRAKGAGEEVIRAALHAQNAQFETSLPDQDVERIVQSVLRYPAGTALRDQREIVPPLQRLSVADLAKNPALLAAPAMLLNRLVWSGRGSLFAGREKDGKTTYAAWAVVEAARDGRTTLWLSTDEDQGTIVSRFVHLAEQGLGITDQIERDLILDRISVLDRDPGNWEEIDALHTEGWKPDVYVIDTLSSFLMAVDGKVPETSEGEKWQDKVLRFKSWIKNTPSGVLALAHAGRADGSYRGSTGIGAALDAIITYYGGLTDPFVRRLERKGRHGIGGAKTSIKYRGDEHPGFEEVAEVGVARERVLDPFAKAPVQRFLLVVLESTGAAGITEAEWRTRAEAEHSVGPKGSFSKARDGLNAGGYAEKRGDRWHAIRIV
jgi:Primase C terminal 1 (PriCT-1)